MAEGFNQYLHSKWLYLAIGFLLGALSILGIRYATYDPHDTHYHANFGVYIDGQRQPFKGPQYYQEVNVCALHGDSPAARVHMHNNENGVIHVHADAVTWGQFFTNLGWIVGPDVIRTPNELYVADEDRRVNIILNGQTLTDISSIDGQVISNKDRLLVSYGDIDENGLKQQDKSIPDNAAAFNSKPDPSSCAGAHTVTPAERLRNLF